MASAPSGGLRRLSEGHAISAARLRKEYGRGLIAVSDVTFAVDHGEVFGFLGPNGAGKTTTLKMLLGLVTPTAGRARILSHPPHEPEVRRQVGFLPEHFRFMEWLSGRELLEYHARLYGMAAEDRRRRIPELLERVALADRGDAPLREYSKGMRQRIGLAQALLNRPRVVFLDEPTSGLDPLGTRLVRDVIRELRDAGVTVFLNSHLLGEVEIVCDRVAMLRRGRIVHVAEPRALPGGGQDVEMEVSGLAEEHRQGLALDLEGHWEADVFRFPVPTYADGREHVAGTLDRVVSLGGRVYRVEVRRPSLEDVFVAVIGEANGK